MQDRDNPFAAPAADSTGPQPDAPELYGRVPGSIRLASAALVVIVVIDILCYANDTLTGVGTYPAFDITLVAFNTMLLVGTALRARLAKRAGRILYFFFAAFLTLGLAAFGVSVFLLLTTGDPPIEEILDSASDIDFWALLTISAASWNIFFAFGTVTAKAYFQDFCPQCQSGRTTAANFFNTKAKCKACGEVW